MTAHKCCCFSFLDSDPGSPEVSRAISCGGPGREEGERSWWPGEDARDEE